MSTVNILYIPKLKTHLNILNKKNYAGEVTGILITLTESPGKKRLTQHIDPGKHSVIKLTKNKLVRENVCQWHFFESLQTKCIYKQK